MISHNKAKIHKGINYPHIENLSFIAPNRSERFNYWVKPERLGFYSKSSKKYIKTTNLI